MGFLDKAKETLGEATKAAQEGMADMTAKRKADGLLRELGAWTYAKHKGGYPEADGNLTRGLGELAAHEAEHGELGAKAEEPPPVPAAAPPPPPPAAPPAPPPAATTGGEPVPPPPPAPGDVPHPPAPS